MISSYKFFIFSSIAFLLSTQVHLHTTTLDVSLYTDANSTGGGNSGDLRFALNSILNAQAQSPSTGPWQINFTSGAGTIQLNNPLPVINLFNADTVSFNSTAQAIVIDGNSANRGFFIRQGNVTFQNMTIQNCLATGGNGGGGAVGAGGGGMGAGGALFIDQATVNLQNIQFTNNSCQGGSGGIQLRMDRGEGEEGVWVAQEGPRAKQLWHWRRWRRWWWISGQWRGCRTFGSCWRNCWRRRWWCGGSRRGWGTVRRCFASRRWRRGRSNYRYRSNWGGRSDWRNCCRWLCFWRRRRWC